MPELSERAVLEALTVWAEADVRVRALILESSRARPGAQIDALSDYDVLVIADPAEMAGDEAWMSATGTPLVCFRDATAQDGVPTLTRLVLYETGLKVDYQIWPPELIRRAALAERIPDIIDVGYRVLVDKDGVTRSLGEASYTAHVLRPPTADEYRDLVEEFWWESQYVAKSLWRDDLFPAKYAFDVVMKLDLLRRMLEWRVAMDTGWTFKPGRIGRGLKTHFEASTWEAVEHTFVGADVQDNWQALDEASRLFGTVAREVADRLGFAYPNELERKMTA